MSLITYKGRNFDVPSLNVTKQDWFEFLLVNGSRVIDEDTGTWALIIRPGFSFVEGQNPDWSIQQNVDVLNAYLARENLTRAIDTGDQAAIATAADAYAYIISGDQAALGANPDIASIAETVQSITDGDIQAAVSAVVDLPPVAVAAAAGSALAANPTLPLLAIVAAVWWFL